MPFTLDILIHSSSGIFLNEIAILIVLLTADVGVRHFSLQFNVILAVTCFIPFAKLFGVIFHLT